MSGSESQSSLEGRVTAVSEKPKSANIDLDQIGETRGYALDEKTLKQDLGLPAAANLKKAADGHTVLIPQPTDDPNDPLNWPSRKKWIVLLVVSISACTADYGSATGAVTLLPQAQEWHLNPNIVNHATAGNVFMLGAGGIFVVWFSAYFGRLPVLVFFQCLSVGTAAWCATATSFNSYMAARILNGLFSVVAAAGGLMFIKDIFFFHEHPRKINIWATSLILSPFLAPLITACIVASASWRWAFWVCTIAAAVGLILTIAFVDETFYPRNLMPDQRPVRKSRLMRLVGIEQRRTKLIGNTFFGAAKRPATTLTKLPVFLSVVYYFFTFAWVIGNNTTISVFVVPLYNWGYYQIAAIYVAPIIGCAAGLGLGHFLHDMLANVYAKRHGGKIQPEARLIIIWFATPLIIVGMNMIGSSLQHRYHYMILAVGWFLHNFSIIIVTTAINAYALDSYPEASGEVAAWLNAGRTIGGFVVGYIQITWAESMGTQKEFGIQSAIVAAAFVIIVVLQFHGARLRALQGPCDFATH